MRCITPTIARRNKRQDKQHHEKIQGKAGFKIQDQEGT